MRPSWWGLCLLGFRYLFLGSIYLFIYLLDGGFPDRESFRIWLGQNFQSFFGKHSHLSLLKNKNCNFWTVLSTWIYFHLFFYCLWEIDPWSVEIKEVKKLHLFPLPYLFVSAFDFILFFANFIGVDLLVPTNFCLVFCSLYFFLTDLVMFFHADRKAKAEFCLESDGSFSRFGLSCICFEKGKEKNLGLDEWVF